MKKTLAILVALVMMLSASLTFAEELPAVDYDSLVVGTTTAMSGHFFTDLWGSNATDIDVRALLHGYNLVEWNGETGNFGIDPSVLSGIASSTDETGNRTYTIVLYDDLYYSDGTPITAKDYAFSMLFRISPAVAQIGGAVNGLDYIVGAEEYKRGDVNTLSGLRIIGDHQFSITVKAEYLPFFYELALLDVTPYPISVIAPGCEVADDGNGAYIRNADGSADSLFTADLLRQTVLDPANGYLSRPSVVSGPYVLTAYDETAGVAEFEINPYYKGNSKGQQPLITYLTVKHVPNEDVIAQLESGELGLANKYTQADVLDAGMVLARDGIVTVRNYPRSGQSFISFSCERPTVESAAVRQAIAYCLDKDAFIQAYVRNYGMRVDGYYGIGQWMYQLVAGTLAAPVEEPEAGASKAEMEEYEAEVEAWEAITLDELKTYTLDVEEAKKLLENDGWNKNAQGGQYADGVRYKEIEGNLLPLSLKLAYPEGNAVEQIWASALEANLAAAGIELTVEAVPFTELLTQYYRQEARDYDMIYLSTNFASVFDPAPTFDVADAAVGLNNRTGIVDDELYQLAADMRKTEPGDTLSYCQKWVAFQNHWVEVLPSIPVYSNVYMDFVTPMLYDYNAGSEVSWAQAIIGAYLSDPPVEEEAVEGEEEVFGDEEIEFVD